MPRPIYTVQPLTLAEARVLAAAARAEPTRRFSVGQRHHRRATPIQRANTMRKSDACVAPTDVMAAVGTSTVCSAVLFMPQRACWWWVVCFYALSLSSGIPAAHAVTCNGVRRQRGDSEAEERRRRRHEQCQCS